jgi:hypothetical protein
MKTKDVPYAIRTTQTIRSKTAQADPSTLKRKATHALDANRKNIRAKIAQDEPWNVSIVERKAT